MHKYRKDLDMFFEYNCLMLKAAYCFIRTRKLYFPCLFLNILTFNKEITQIQYLKENIDNQNIAHHEYSPKQDLKKATLHN